MTWRLGLVALFALTALLPQAWNDGSHLQYCLSVIERRLPKLLVGSEHLVKASDTRIQHRTSWIGNSFGGNSERVQSAIEAIWVSPEGSVYTNSIWDESGQEAGVYRDGRPQMNAGSTHGWGMLGGKAVTANRAYFFLGAQMDSEGGKLVNESTWPRKGVNWFGISRRPRANIRAAASFKGGKGGAGDTLNASFLPVNEAPEKTDAAITGLAASDKELFVSNAYRNEVRVYDCESMALLRTFPFHHPGKLAVDRDGDLWIIEGAAGSASGVIRHYSALGEHLPNDITDSVDPSDASFDNKGRLLIADSGPAQQILIYAMRPYPRKVGTLGIEGGIYSGKAGETGDDKLISPIGIGTDNAGSVYIASTLAGAEIRKYSATGVLLWHLMGLEFIDTAVADPDFDGADVYTKDEHFTMDYSQAEGREAVWKGMTIHKLKYPTDPRISLPNSGSNSVVAFRNIRRHKYLFLTNQYSSFLIIYRMDGEIAIPSGMIAPVRIKGWLPHTVPQTGSFIWRDANGNGNLDEGEFSTGPEEAGVWGWDIDMRGDVWQARENAEGVRVLHLQGVDRFGNLEYDRTHITAFGLPTPFRQVERVQYESDTDTMYVSGYTAARGLRNGFWGQVGTEICRYDKWSRGTRTPRWQISLPYDPATNQTIKSIAIAGKMVFAGLLGSSSTASIYVYDAGNGSALGQLTPGPEVGRMTGWIDGSHNLRAFQRSVGEYLVFVEEVAWNKVLMYRFGPSESLASVSTTNPASARR
jgi:hypothetical protein